MKLTRAGRKVVVVEQDGRMNAPFSFFLNHIESKNPNTQQSYIVSLKLLHRFMEHYKIPLAERALQGRCLEHREMSALISLAFRPIEELSDRRSISRAVDVRNAEADEDRKDAVAGSTASQRLKEIGQFLRFYKGEVSQYIRSPDTKQTLEAVYDACVQHLGRAVGGAAAASVYDIRSMSSSDFERCMFVAYCDPKALVESIGSERHLLRDRAMFFLSCEGLRPGEIGNLRINDLVRTPDGTLMLQVAANKRHRKKVDSSTPLPKGASSTVSLYATVRMITLWPYTRDVLNQYINGPRAKAVAQAGRDLTSGFVFLKSNGEPLESRQAIDLRFNQMCKSLQAAGHMKIDVRPGRGDKATENTETRSAYTMRHSAASFFYATQMAIALKGMAVPDRDRAKESVRDKMNARYGWTDKSGMFGHYAKRAIVDSSRDVVNDLYEEMQAEVARKRNSDQVKASGSLDS